MDNEDLVNIISRFATIAAVILIILAILIVTDTKPQNNQYNYCPCCGAKMKGEVKREILFRGKCVEVGIHYKRWLEGFYGEDDGKALIAHNTDLGMVGYFCDSDTIGQYTGITDKNGKRIFEGDILFDPYPSIQKYYSVIWSGGSFVRRTVEGYYLSLNALNADEYEVIGNIHDNPELLERRANMTTEQVIEVLDWSDNDD